MTASKRVARLAVYLGALFVAVPVSADDRWAAELYSLRCATCHGADLFGMDPIPGLAGRSPSYIARQLYDMKHDFRKGEWTTQMKPVVAKLSSDDMLAIAAFLASRSVPPAPTTSAAK